MNLPESRGQGLDQAVASEEKYEPLARYGPQTHLAVRETFFAPSVTADILRDASRDISSANNWPGFQFVLLLHDGIQPRALSFWKSRMVLDNFVERHQSANLDYIATLADDNPWLTDIDSRRIGAVDVHLADASMPAIDGEMFIWSPPGVVRICEIDNLTDPGWLRDWWPSVTSPSSPHSMAEVGGLQFFSAVRYPDNRYTTYLGFRSQADLDAYLLSDLHQLHDGEIRTEDFQRSHTIVVQNGRLIAWFQRQVG
jgi:hypothetical protein